MRNGFGGRGALALLVAALAGCSATAATAPMDEGDWVYSGVGPTEANNLERFDAFLAVTGSGGADAVRIVSMTVEGDPIYTDISYSEGKYEVYVDASADAFASADDRERTKAAECTRLVVSDRPDEFSDYACGSFSFVLKDL